MPSKKYLFLFFLAISLSGFGQMAAPVDMEIDGLLIDNTKSKMGHDFYQAFYRKWVPPIGAKNYSIVLKERPSRGRGAQVIILLNDRIIDVRNIQPNAVVLDKTADLAKERVRKYLENYDKIQRELDSDDQTGSGLF